MRTDLTAEPLGSSAGWPSAGGWRLSANRCVSALGSWFRSTGLSERFFDSLSRCWDSSRWYAARPLTKGTYLGGRVVGGVLRQASSIFYYA
jgi:hypothetical protein